MAATSTWAEADCSRAAKDLAFPLPTCWIPRVCRAELPCSNRSPSHTVRCFRPPRTRTSARADPSDPAPMMRTLLFVISGANRPRAWEFAGLQFSDRIQPIELLGAMVRWSATFHPTAFSRNPEGARRSNTGRRRACQWIWTGLPPTTSGIGNPTSSRCGRPSRRRVGRGRTKSSNESPWFFTERRNSSNVTGTCQGPANGTESMRIHLAISPGNIAAFAMVVPQAIVRRLSPLSVRNRSTTRVSPAGSASRRSRASPLL